MSELIKFTVKRSNWYRGQPAEIDENGERFHYGEGSCLLRPSDGEMCCLGFLARRLGFKAEHIEGFSVPSSIEYYSESYDQERFVESTSWHEIVVTNDNDLILETEREKSLTRLFSEKGYQVEFVD